MSCKCVFPRWDITLASGEVIPRATIQANGGLLREPAVLAACAERAREGRRLPVYEPSPGCVSVHPHETAHDVGEAVAAPLAGTTFRLVCCGG